MKKFLFLGAMAAMLLGTASCSNDMEPEITGDGNVQFTIELPGNIDSRAISDGLIATKLQVAVYKEDGTLLQDISLLGDKAVTMSGKKATVNFKLVKGLTYKFAFWAQKPGCEAYAFNASTGKVTVDYSKALANVDDGDAFSNTATLTVTGPKNETIYLYRPFAQLNYGDVMEDYAAAIDAGIDFSKTQVTVKQVATEFDIMNQKTSATTKVDVTWPAAASAIADENLKVEGVDYKWLLMCYFLVPNDESTVTTELSLLNTAGTEFNKITVDNVPVKKNHRTNILGNLFTDDVNFNIIIDERFDQPDYNVVLWDGHSTETPAYDEATQTWTISNPNQLAGFAKQVSEGKTFAGETVVLDKDINLNDKTWTPIGWVTTYQDSKSFKGTFNGQGHAINNFRIAVRNYGSGLFFRVDGGATIKNLNVDQAFVTGYLGGNVVGIVAGYAYQTVTFENIKVTNSLVSGYGKVGGILGMAADPTGGNTTFKNCTVKDVQFHGFYNIGGLAGLIQGVYNNDIETSNTVDCQTWRLYGTNYKFIDETDNVTVTSKDGNSTKPLVGLYWLYQGDGTQLFSALGKYFTYFDNAYGAQNITIGETVYNFGSTAGFNFGDIQGYEIMQ